MPSSPGEVERIVKLQIEAGVADREFRWEDRISVIFVCVAPGGLVQTEIISGTARSLFDSSFFQFGKQFMKCVRKRQTPVLKVVPERNQARAIQEIKRLFVGAGIISN